MRLGRWLVEAMIVFAVSLVVTITVSVFWNLIAHRTTAIDWQTSFRFAIVLATIVPWVTSRRANQR